MTAIKGQNLRIFIGQKPVARAQSCQVHIAAEVQDISSKDSVDGWVENVVTGFSWDASVDALVIPNAAALMENGEFTSVTSTDEMDIDDDTTAYISNYVIPIPAGDTIVAEAPGSASNVVYIIDIESGESLASATNLQDASYTNSSSAAIEVYVGCSADNQSIRYTIGEGESAETADTIVPQMLEDADVNVTFSVTTGDMNRTESTTWLSGSARISDISINATNRQLATYSCSLTGTGTLTAS